MKYAQWNFDNRPEGFETTNLGFFNAWESLVIFTHIFFIGSFVALGVSIFLFATGNPEALAFTCMGIVWLVFSTPFILWFKSRFQQHQQKNSATEDLRKNQ
jgi:MFS-type transporter involved in bile tolerance (Atg22 family)